VSGEIRRERSETVIGLEREAPIEAETGIGIKIGIEVRRRIETGIERGMKTGSGSSTMTEIEPGIRTEIEEVRGTEIEEPATNLLLEIMDATPYGVTMV
jgi:hypothetical protein